MIPDKAVKKVKNDIHLEIAAGSLVAYGVFPQTQEGIELAKQTAASKDTWLAPSDLPDYYDGIDSDLMTGKETPGIRSIRETLREFYNLLPVNPPAATVLEQVEMPKIPVAHYMQGTRGRWNPEFESDFDHAVYFAGKSPLPKGVKQKEVLEWLKSLGLTFKQINDHRDKVLEKILETINLPGVEEEYPYVYIDEVERDFYIDGYDDEDEDDDEEDFGEDLEGLDDLLDFVRSEEEDEEEEENIDLSDLDDLLNAVREDEDQPENQQETKVAEEIVDEATKEPPVDINDALDDLPADLVDSLVNFINKRTDAAIETPGKRKSTSITNTKIYNFLTKNIIKIQGQFDSINESIKEQNNLIAHNYTVLSDIYDKVSAQDNILVFKLDQLTNAIKKQTDQEEEYQDKREDALKEQQLETKRDAASTEGFISTVGNKQKKRESKISAFYKRRLMRRLYRRLPRKLIKARSKVFSLKKTARSKIVSSANKLLPQKAKSFIGSAKNIRSAPTTNIARGAGKNLPGVRQALAAWEFADRKAAGQSTVQAAAGVGGGLAGAGLGAGLVSAGIALLPSAPTGFGAVAAGGLILLGSVLGGTAGGAVADKLTGVKQHETGGFTKPGEAILHGTEAIIPKDQLASLNPVGGALLAATSQFVTQSGAIAAPIAPTFKQISTPLVKEFGMPSTIVQTNVGGKFPTMESTLKKIKEKRKVTPEEELSQMEKDLLETQDPKSFADKLLNMIDPEGKFQELLKKINNGGGGGDITPGEGGEVSAEPFVLLGGSQDPGQAGIDFTLKGSQNRAVLAGTVVEIGHQYNPNATGGDGRKGAGYGHYVVIRSTNPVDGSQVDMLYAHFPKGEIKVKKGDSVSVGQDLGRMATAEDYANPVTRQEVGSGTGPHTSLDFFTPGSTQAHPKARELGSYILSELGKGGKGAIEKARQQAYNQQQTKSSTGDYDVIIPLDHVKPGNENKIPDKKGGNTFKNAAATGADGRERQHQDAAANKVKAKLEADGLRVKIITPEDFGNYEDYDNYIRSQSSKGTRIVPLHFDAAVGQGGTGFLTRVRKGDAQDASLAKPLQKALSNFQRSNPELGNLGGMDTVNNATINRAAEAPAALVEMGSMVAWEKKYGKNFTSSKTFDQLATAIASGISSSIPDKNISAPTSAPKVLRGENISGDTSQLAVVVQSPSKPQPVNMGRNSEVDWVMMNNNTWRTNQELSSSARKLLIQRLSFN